ncbi:unnamed protein product, partial [Meganyctiphanes norvegica]
MTVKVEMGGEVSPKSKKNLEEEEDERGNWGNQCEFFLSCLGFAVGFGNVWRFPYLCYKNGGAVFLIPYIVMLMCAGLPIFFMELALGQYGSLGPNLIFPEIAPFFGGLGWAMVMISALVSIYYNIIMAWAVFYTFASFSSVLPWSHCNNNFNSDGCYTEEAQMVCTNKSMLYFNNMCLRINHFCGIGNYVEFNETHCMDPNNTNIIKPANEMFKRISASEDYFKNRMLEVTDRTWDDMGSMRWELVGCLALSWLIVAACLAKGVKSSGKVVYFTALFPYVVLIILFIRGITLEGAMRGIEFYIMKPDISKLWELEVWSDAATQIFYSLGSSFGGLITLASYNKFKNNCMRDAILIAFANCSTSVFAGFVIFSILGFLATELGVEVGDVVSSGSGLAFIVYPAAVTRMPFPPLWALLFFLMLITLGLDSQFTMVETVVTAILDQWKHLRAHKMKVVFGTCGVLFILGLTMCLQGGILMFELFNGWSAGISVIICAILEIIVISYVYGIDKFIRHITDDMGIYMPRPLKTYWYTTWSVVTPGVLLVILALSMYNISPAAWGDYIYEDHIQILAWFVCISSVAIIPICTCWVVWKGDVKWNNLWKHTENFCPAQERNARGRGSTGGAKADVFRYTHDNEGFVKEPAEIYPTLQEEKPPLYNNGIDIWGYYSNHM